MCQPEPVLVEQTGKAPRRQWLPSLTCSLSTQLLKESLSPARTSRHLWRKSDKKHKVVSAESGQADGRRHGKQPPSALPVLEAACLDLSKTPQYGTVTGCSDRTTHTSDCMLWRLPDLGQSAMLTCFHQPLLSSKDDPTLQAWAPSQGKGRRGQTFLVYLASSTGQSELRGKTLISNKK